jgi:hypothetical protein
MSFANREGFRKGGKMKLQERVLKSGVLLAILVLGLAGSLAAQTTVPVGTPISVTLNQSVSSKDAKAGQTVSAVVSADVVVDNKTVIPKNSNATLTVATAVASGRLSTPAKLYLRIDSIQVKGQTYTVSTNMAGRTEGSHTKRNAIAIGGGTAAGAIIGGLAGGGKGAAIGAAAGAGAGTGGAALTGKKDITYAAESRLSFRLKDAVAIK